MGVTIKNLEEIKTITEGSNILSSVLGMLSKEIKPGISTLKLDKLAEEYIRDNNARPSFKNFKGYKHVLCTSVNDEIVHGLPSDYILKEGDICSVDCGVLYKGYHSDSAFTYFLGDKNEKVEKLLSVTYNALMIGISNINKNSTTGDIGNSIQSYVENNQFSVIRDLVGHGIGKNLHEPPEFPNYGRKQKGYKIRNGMVFAIEPMVAVGKYDIVYSPNDWTIKTKDGSLSAHFEHTIAMIDDKPEVLTTFEKIDQKFFKILYGKTTDNISRWSS